MKKLITILLLLSSGLMFSQSENRITTAELIVINRLNDTIIIAPNTAIYVNYGRLGNATGRFPKTVDRGETARFYLTEADLANTKLTGQPSPNAPKQKKKLKLSKKDKLRLLGEAAGAAVRIIKD